MTSIRSTLPRPVRAAMLRALALATLATACATAPSGTPVRMTDLPAAPPPGAPFQAIGELIYSGGRSAAYDFYRVVGPTVNVTYGGDGKWSGNLDGRNVMLTAAPGRLTGSGVDLHVFQDGDQTTIRGRWVQRDVWLTISPKALSGRTVDMGPAFDFKRTALNVMSGNTGIGPAGLELRGEAQQLPNVAMPQFVLALLAALPP